MALYYQKPGVYIYIYLSDSIRKNMPARFSPGFGRRILAGDSKPGGGMGGGGSVQAGSGK